MLLIHPADRERHLGHAQRLAAIGAIENHIGHLAAAQRLGRLLAQYPTDSVGDIGLTTPIGADDGRDARAEN